MANEENLKKGELTQFRSGEEAARNGSKGGKASGEARRKKAGIKRRLQEALDLNITSNGVKKLVRSMGMDPEEATNYDALTASLLLKGIVLHDTTAIQMIMNYIGESPDEKRREEDAKRKREIYRYQKEQMKEAENRTGEKEDDGFLDALKDAVEEDWNDGGD